ncbi:MAG: gamma carbonic anhydrase family protein [Thermoplasmata archaeon]
MTSNIDNSAYIAEEAVIIGDVTLGKMVSVWPCAVLRGDINTIAVDEFSNIQDNCVLHVTKKDPVKIGKYVTLGHGAVVHGATVGDYCIIGMNATVLDGAEIGEGSIVGAGAVVSPGTKIPAGSMALGVPAKVVKTDPTFKEMARANAMEYLELAARHSKGEFTRYMP